MSRESPSANISRTNSIPTSKRHVLLDRTLGSITLAAIFSMMTSVRVMDTAIHALPRRGLLRGLYPELHRSDAVVSSGPHSPDPEPVTLSRYLGVMGTMQSSNGVPESVGPNGRPVCGRLSALLHGCCTKTPDRTRDLFLRFMFYLQTREFTSGPAWTRTRDLFLIREAL